MSPRLRVSLRVPVPASPRPRISASPCLRVPPSRRLVSSRVALGSLILRLVRTRSQAGRELFQFVRLVQIDVKTTTRWPTNAQ